MLVGVGGDELNPLALVENVVGRVWTGKADDDDLCRLWDLYTTQHRHGG